MRRFKGVFILAVALLLLAPALVMAQDSASKDFPNDKDGDTANVDPSESGTMDFGLIMSAPGAGLFPNVHTKQTGNTVFLAGGERGEEVAAASANALCSAAVDEGYKCTGLFTAGTDTCGPGTPDYNMDPKQCCTAADDGLTLVNCVIEAFGDRGFTIDRPANDVGFVVTNTGSGTKLNALNNNTKAGNTVITDMLPRFCLRVDRGGPAVDGLVTFSVTVAPLLSLTGPITSTFTVNTTGLSDTLLHQAIAAGLSSLGLGLDLGVLDSPGDKCGFPETFNGPLVSIGNLTAVGVLEIGISGLAGQDIVAETNQPIKKIQRINPLL